MVGWREACVRLAFALFLEITLFVVLLSLYIFTGGRFTFSTTPVSCLSACLVVHTSVCMARSSHVWCLSLSLLLFLPPPSLHHRDFVIPRFLRQCMRRRKRSYTEVSVALGESNVSLARLLQVVSRLADSR